MLVGHFAAAMIGKRIEPRLSLGTLAMAAMVPDLLWSVFLLGGIEHVQFKPGLGAANYLAATDIAWSHGLVTGAVWAALLAGAYYGRRRYQRGAWILLAVVLSHWVLDFASHRPDMPLAPGVPARFGLGLWTSVPATLLVEGGLWVSALVVYVRATRARNLAGVLVFWVVATILTLAWYNNVAGPPPPNPRVAPVFSFVFFSLIVAWAYWMNRLRPAQDAAVQP
jgi:hypothetical protein